MERTMGFNSTTGAVKALVMEFVEASEKAVERKDLVAYINKKMGYNDRLTDGVIAGAIKILINSGELVTVRRGCYEKGTGKTKASAFERIFGICERFGADLDRACTVNIMDLTEQEREIYPKFFNTLVSGKGSVEMMVEDLRVLLDSIKPIEAVENTEGLVDIPSKASDEEVAQVVEPVRNENVEPADEGVQEPEMVEKEPEGEKTVDAESADEEKVDGVESTVGDAVIETPATEEGAAETETVELEGAVEENVQPAVEEVAPIEESAVQAAEETGKETETALAVEEAAVTTEQADGSLTETTEQETEASTEEVTEGKKSSRRRNRKNH